MLGFPFVSIVFWDHQLALSGHNSRDRSECVNVIGVTSEPFAVNGREWIVIVRVICDWNEPLALHHHSLPFSDLFVCLFSMICESVAHQQTREWRSIRKNQSPWIVNVHASDYIRPWIQWILNIRVIVWIWRSRCRKNLNERPRASRKSMLTENSEWRPH